MKYDAAVIRDWFTALLAPKVRLSDWEQSFIDSVYDQFERKGTLSDKQVAVLERIYADKT